MRMIDRALLAAGAAGLLCGFAPVPPRAMVDGHLPARTEIGYGFDCAFGRIGIGFAERIASQASAERYRTLELLTFSVSGRRISPGAFGEVATLLRSYERIESVGAECGSDGTASLHLRGLRKADWQAHIAGLEAESPGAPRAERPRSVTTDIIVAPAGTVAIRG
jgi:hypothetical protein